MRRKVTITIEFDEWVVPDFITAKSSSYPYQDMFEEIVKQDRFGKTIKWELFEVDANILSKQCDTFRAEVFRKAKKDDPKLVINNEW